MGLDARLKKEYRVMTTDSRHTDPISPRLFRVEDDNPLPNKPGKVLAGDITYLKLDAGHIYLAVVMDLYNREIDGWSINDTLQTSIVLDALSAAMGEVGPDAEIIFHSDRGSQYTSEAYRKLIKAHRATPSMSRKGNCYDNGVPRMRCSLEVASSAA
ncbi:MAG: DDE-type integrase/transposase/recombinase [Bdellovibrionota bacterium]|nr:DDE-type integrase/transposase/recombinase [Bdellovibrionota bacterium]